MLVCLSMLIGLNTLAQHTPVSGKTIYIPKELLKNDFNNPDSK